jgi:hypothetical protein
MDVTKRTVVFTAVFLSLLAVFGTARSPRSAGMEKRLALSVSGSLLPAQPANPQDDQGEVEKILVLQPTEIPGGVLFGHSGQAGVIRIAVEEGRTTLQFSLTGLTPNAVHSAWLHFDNGINPCGSDGQPACPAPFTSCNGPMCVALDPARGTPVNVFSFTPAAPDDAGFTAGNGLDPNGFVSDGDGNAKFKIKLNYDIFQANVAPLVLRPGVSEGLAVAFDALGTTRSSSLFTPGVTPLYTARVDSAYMREYRTSALPDLPATSPSYQLLDASGKPLLVRGTVRGFQVLEHFDRLTHGHVKGFAVDNPAASSCGDFDKRLVGNLANATPDD